AHSMKLEPLPQEPPTVVQRLLMGLVGAVCRVPWLVLGVTLILCGLAAYSSLTRLEYRTKRSDLINPRKDYQQRWQDYVTEFGDDDDIVVVVQGHDHRKMKQALEALAARVARRPDRFDRLFYKVDLRPLHNRALLYLPKEQIEQIQDNLRRMSLLLDPPLV